MKIKNKPIEINKRSRTKHKDQGKIKIRNESIKIKDQGQNHYKTHKDQGKIKESSDQE